MRRAWMLAILLLLVAVPAAHAAGTVTIRKLVGEETVRQAGTVTVSYDQVTEDDVWQYEHTCGTDCPSLAFFAADDCSRTACNVVQTVDGTGTAAPGFTWDGCGNCSNRRVEGNTTITGRFTDVQAPAVTFASPPSETRDFLTVAADATDNHRVARMDFVIGGQVVATDDTPVNERFEATIDVRGIAHNAAVTVFARGYDPSGRTDDDVRTFRIDRDVSGQFAAPTPAAGSWVTAGSPRISFDADSDVTKAECRVGSGAYALCGSLPWTPPTPTDGAYTVDVRLTDNMDNVRTLTTSFKVDRTAPALTVTAPVAGATLPGGFTPAFTAADAMTSPPHVACALDDGAFGPCGPVAKPADGSHTLRVRARDDAGHETLRTVGLTIDGTPPALAFTGGPPENAILDRPDATFALAAPDLTAVRLTCALDRAAPAPCTGADRHALRGMPDGPHTLAVVATDAAGNVARITRGFTVNAATPTVAITSGPAEGSAIASRATAFGFSVTGASEVRCALDDAPWRPCSGADAHALVGLADGAHTFRVRARDATDDVAVASRAFRVDTSAPETRIDAGPADGAAVPADAVTFAFSATVPDATFRCRWGGTGAFTPCSGPGNTHRVGRLAPGRHVFEVQAVNALGTPDPTPERRRFTLLKAAPPLQFRVTNLWGLPSRSEPRTRVVKLALTRLAKGAAVRVRCRGGGCPFKRKAGKARRGGVNLTKLFRGRKLRPGTVVEIRVTLRGADGRVVRFVVRKRGIPKRTDLCLPAGAKRPKRC